MLAEKAVQVMYDHAVSEALGAKDWTEGNYCNGMIFAFGLVLGKSPAEINAAQVHGALPLTTRPPIAPSSTL